MSRKKIVIIGNGIAGVTAARFIRKMSDHDILMISDETDHFYSRTALMYIYMGHMTYHHTKPYEDHFWEKNRIDLQRGYVESVDFHQKRLNLAGGTIVKYDLLILATGSKTRMFGWEGADLRGVSGLYHLQDLTTMEEYTEGIDRGVIVGGGLIGIEMAEMLRSRNIDVSFLVREQEYWSNILPAEEGSLISNHVRNHHIDLRLETELQAILPDSDGRVRAIRTSRGEEIPCQFVGIATGVRPNVDFLKGSGLDIEFGIQVDDTFATNVPDVYAIGDCAHFRNPLPGHPPVEQLWYTGRMHGETVARTICGMPTSYVRGVWFNSAKFFDIEYQTYGYVSNMKREQEESFYREDRDRRRAMRIVYRKENKRVIGVNLFGLRGRQDVWEEWLMRGATLDEVLGGLPRADFDPEFTGTWRG